MAIGVTFHFPDATLAQYDQVITDLNGGPMRTPSDWPVSGLLVHVAGQGEDGLHVTDVWETREQFDAFGKVLVPALDKAGFSPATPVFFPVHALVTQ